MPSFVMFGDHCCRQWDVRHTRVVVMMYSKVQMPRCAPKSRCHARGSCSEVACGTSLCTRNQAAHAIMTSHEQSHRSICDNLTHVPVCTSPLAMFITSGATCVRFPAAMEPRMFTESARPCGHGALCKISLSVRRVHSAGAPPVCMKILRVHGLPRRTCATTSKKRHGPVNRLAID
jgi:hypothetical protein